MKHYTTPDGVVWAFEADGSQDHLIKPDMQPMSEAEVQRHRNPPPTPQSLARQELAELEAQITPAVLADAILSGNTAQLRAINDRVKAARERAK